MGGWVGRCVCVKESCFVFQYHHVHYTYFPYLYSNCTIFGQWKPKIWLPRLGKMSASNTETQKGKGELKTEQGAKVLNYYREC